MISATDRVPPGRLVVMTLLFIALASCQKSQSPELKPGTVPSPVSVVTQAAANDEPIIAFCGGCHAMPKPDSFPKSAWYDEVKRGFDFYHQSHRKDLSPPPLQPVVEYFRSRAPATLDASPDKSFSGPERVRFRSEEIPMRRSGGTDTKPAAISFVGHWPLQGPGSSLLFNDMANGGLYIANLHGIQQSSDRIAELKHPAGASGCDLNGNGLMDLVVADLGSFNPADHDRGRVMWLADVEDASRRSTTALIDGLGRVADVQPADFDADGDIDLIVAEFGWHKTGRILYLRNDGDSISPKYISTVVDPRPGAIHVPVVDLNRDGRPDFVALISQEFEVIEAFLNQGDGTFAKHSIHAANDPAFGSSGIQVVDMDGDGDADILYSNGDMFDSFLIKPCHGIQWLENTGRFPYVPHRLTAFPGAHRALAGDLDGDGDLDIVAAAFLPAAVRESEAGKRLESLIWLEQLRHGEYIRHALETGNCLHAALDLTDLDGDGDLDIACGSFRDGGSSDQSAVTIWWNETSTP